MTIVHVDSFAQVLVYRPIQNKIHTLEMQTWEIQEKSLYLRSKQWELWKRFAYFRNFQIFCYEVRLY